MFEKLHPTLAAYRGFTPFLIEEILKKPRYPATNAVTSPTSEVQGPQDLTWNRNYRGSTSMPILPDVSAGNKEKLQLPAWVYCTRYSDRPSAGPRCRKRSSTKKRRTSSQEGDSTLSDGAPGSHNQHHQQQQQQQQQHQQQRNSAQKRLRTAFSSEQLRRLQTAFQGSHYLTDSERASLASALQLNEAQIKIWFQNKRAKLKKNSGVRNELALQLMAEGLYNHTSTNEP